MKNPVNFHPTIYLLLISAICLYACGGGDGNTGAKFTEIDSAEDTAAVQMDHMGSTEDEAVNEQTGVRVPMQENSNFNWEDFRNTLQAGQQAIGEGYHLGEDEVASSWEKLNDEYSYQTVYKYKDQQLWLQTYYRGNNPTSETDSLEQEKGQLLTKEASQQSEFGDLWKKMEQKAKDLGSGNFK
jgi:hypothetical protein